MRKYLLSLQGEIPYSFEGRRFRAENIMSSIHKDTKMAEQKTTQDVPRDIYKILMEVSPICTVDILFFNPEKTHILLGRRVNNPYRDMFYTFGGRLRKNETFEDAAIRIAEKETGISVLPTDMKFGGVDNEISDSSVFENTNYHAVALYFGSILSPDTPIKLDAQHSEYQWVDVNDATIHPSIQPRILKALCIIKA